MPPIFGFMAVERGGTKDQQQEEEASQSPPHGTRDPLKQRRGKGDGPPTAATAARDKDTDERVGKAEPRAPQFPSPHASHASELLLPSPPVPRVSVGSHTARLRFP